MHQVDHLAATGAGQAQQPRVIGFLSSQQHVYRRLLALRAAQPRLGRSEVAQAIADDEHGINAADRSKVDRAVAGAAVERQCVDGLEQRSGIAARQTDQARRFGDIAERHQHHLDLPEAAHPGRQGRLFAVALAFPGAARGVVEQCDTARRQRAWTSRCATVDECDDAAPPGFERIDRFECGHRVARLRNPESQLAPWLHAFAGQFGHPARAGLLETQGWITFAGLVHRRTRRQLGLGAQGQALDGRRELHRQHVSPGIAEVDERGRQVQADALVALRRDWIEAGPEDIAGGQLGEARIDALAGDVLEGHAGGLLVDHHAFAKHSVHFERVAGDTLAGREREHQLTFEHACIRVVEDQFDRGLGDEAAAADPDVDGGEGNRLEPFLRGDPDLGRRRRGWRWWWRQRECERGAEQQQDRQEAHGGSPASCSTHNAGRCKSGFAVGASGDKVGGIS
jgi:hypothetical protein